MICKNTQSRLNRYLDGELSPEEARRVEHHLQKCPQCARACEDMKGVNRLLDEVRIPDGAPSSLARRVRREAEDRQTAGIRWLTPLGSVFGPQRVRAAVAAVFLFAGLSAGAYLGWSTVQVDRERTFSAAQAAVETGSEPVSAELAAAPPGSVTEAYLSVSMASQSSTSDTSR